MRALAAVLGLCGLAVPVNAHAETEAELADRAISVCVVAHLEGASLEAGARARGFEPAQDSAWPGRVDGEAAFVWRGDLAEVAVVVDPARPALCRYRIRGEVDLPVLFDALEAKLESAGLARYGGDAEGLIRARWHRSETATAMLVHDTRHEDVGGWVSDRRREPAARPADGR